MKTAIVIANGIKQIMFTPETPEEKQALKMILPSDEITVDIKRGTFYDVYPASAEGYMVQESNGNYLRAYSCTESVMLVLRPKVKANDNL